jgi:hypothetical protein
LLYFLIFNFSNYDFFLVWLWLWYEEQQ